MSDLVIFTTVPDTLGWSPIRHMQRLLSSLTASTVVDLSAVRRGKAGVAIDRLRRRPARRRPETALCIAPNAHEARSFYPALAQAGGFSTTILWLIDSFWTDSVDAERLQISKHFDVIVFMQQFDEDFYTGLFPGRALHIGWGSDVLGLGSDQMSRPIDLLRVGRQPPEWDEDSTTESACNKYGIAFSGRPSFAGNVDAYRELNRSYASAKYVLAHSNTAASASYTHPSKAYITARWTDALANGSSLAGVVPTGDLSLVSWPGALLPMPSIRREENLELVSRAAQNWTPVTATRNHANALRMLDWRWRFQELTKHAGLASAHLDEEFTRLKEEVQLVSQFLED